MEPNEPSEMISEIEDERHEEKAKDTFRSRAALWIAILAAIMAIRGLGGQNAKDEMTAKNIQTSDAWAFYQAKNIRQSGLKLAADELQEQLKFGAITGPRAEAAAKRLKKYQETIARYDTEADRAGDPNAGGKKELMERARRLEEVREQFEHQNRMFDLAEMVFQLALVLASVSILTTSRKLLIASIALGALGAGMTLDAFFLWFDPF